MKDETIGKRTLETESLDEQSSESDSEDPSQGREQNDMDPVCEDVEPVCQTEDREAVCQTEDRQPVQEVDSLDRETEDRSPVQDQDQTKPLEESLSRAPVEGGASDGKNQSDAGLSQKEALPSSPKSPHSPEVNDHRR